MRVVRPDDDTMVVRDLPYVPYFFALVFLAGGFAIAFLGLRGSDGELLMPGAIAAGLGLLFLVLSPITTSTFDRRGNAYEVTRKGILRRTVRSGPLSDVAGVRTDEALTDTTYRVVLILNSGAKLPLSAWWTSSRRRSERVARRIMEFLL